MTKFKSKIKVSPYVLLKKVYLGGEGSVGREMY